MTATPYARTPMPDYEVTILQDSVRGPAGAPAVIVGTVPTMADLPAGPNYDGNLWLADDTGHGWVWQSGVWTDVGQLRGEPGTDALPFIIKGTVATDADLPTTAEPGDTYVVTATAHLQHWTGGDWIDIGPAGAPGPTGPTGPLGPAGATGPVGPQGTQGVQGIIGPGGPIGPVGPIGNPGPTGDTGAQGPVGPEGATGPQGTQGIQGTEGAPGGGTQQSLWTWQAAAATGPLASATVAVNNADPALATQVWIHRVGLTGIDWSTIITAMVAGDHVYLQAKANAASYHRYRVGGPAVANTTSWVIPVTTESGSPQGSEPPDGAELLVAFQFQPLQGVAGPIGPAGPAGAGVPVGGATGTVLKKASGADYDTAWSTTAHQASHGSGQADALTGIVDATARTAVAKAGTTIAARRTLNIIDGANVTSTVVDNPGAERVDITLASSGGGGGGGSGPSTATFKQVRRLSGGNLTTTSTTRTPIDATNIPFQNLDLAVGDIVRCTLQCYASVGAQGNAVYFDFEVDQPVSANTYVAGTQTASSEFDQPQINYVLERTVVDLFVATEAGTHGFRPVWMASGNTATLWNSASAPRLPILFTVEKIPVSATGAVAGGLLAFKQYAAAVDGQTYVTTSTTLVDVDAANLAVTFTVPASGSVLVRCGASMYTNAASAGGYLGLRDAGGIIANSTQYMVSSQALNRVMYSKVFSGLTPGTVLTWKLGWKFAGTGGGVNVSIFTGPTDNGPVVMEVYDATPVGAALASPLLAAVTYNPQPTQTTYATSSQTFADLDPVNLAVSFVGPPSGRVLVRYSAYCNATAGVALNWNVRDAVGNVANSSMQTGYQNDSSVSRSIVLPVTPGVTYNWRWGQAKGNATGGTGNTFAGSAAYGPATMEVWAA